MPAVRESRPVTATGKARSARNALRHGVRARAALRGDGGRTWEPAALDGEFQALASALQAELAPEGLLQADLVGRIVMAVWRGRRAARRSASTSVVGAGSRARLDAALLGRFLAPETADPQAALGDGLIRDGNGSRALETLVRDRGPVLAELFRRARSARDAAGRSGRAGRRGPAACGPDRVDPPSPTTKRTRES
jgi:hypothetical protein